MQISWVLLCRLRGLLSQLCLIQRKEVRGVIGVEKNIWQVVFQVGPGLSFFLFFLFLYGYWVFGSMWEENRDKKNGKAKVNSLYKKKKTAAKFSLASFPLLVNLVHSSWGTPWTEMWNTPVSNTKFPTFAHAFLAVTQTSALLSIPVSCINVSDCLVWALVSTQSKALTNHWPHKNWHWARLTLEKQEKIICSAW